MDVYLFVGIVFVKFVEVIMLYLGKLKDIEEK